MSPWGICIAGETWPVKMTSENNLLKIGCRVSLASQGSYHCTVNTSSPLINEQTVGVSNASKTAELNPTLLTDSMYTDTNYPSFLRENESRDHQHNDNNGTCIGVIKSSTDSDSVARLSTTCEYDASINGTSHLARLHEHHHHLRGDELSRVMNLQSSHQSSPQHNIDYRVRKKRTDNNKSKSHKYINEPARPVLPSSPLSSSSSQSSSFSPPSQSSHSSQFFLRAKSNSNLVSDSSHSLDIASNGQLISDEKFAFASNCTSVISPHLPQAQAAAASSSAHFVSHEFPLSSSSFSSTSSSSPPPSRRMSRFHFPLSPIFLPPQSNHHQQQQQQRDVLRHQSVPLSSRENEAISPDENCTSALHSTSSASSSPFSSTHSLIKQNASSPSSNNLFKLCVSRSSIGSIESQMSNTRLVSSRNISIVSSNISSTSSSGCSHCSSTTNRPKNPKFVFYELSTCIYFCFVPLSLSLFFSPSSASLLSLSPSWIKLSCMSLSPSRRKNYCFTRPAFSGMSLHWPFFSLSPSPSFPLYCIREWSKQERQVDTCTPLSLSFSVIQWHCSHLSHYTGHWPADSMVHAFSLSLHSVVSSLCLYCSWFDYC